MTTRAEDALYYALTEVDSLERLVQMNLPYEAIPTEEMREVVYWATEYFFTSGRKQAPSREALLEVWGQLLDDAEVELIDEDEEVDTIEWAVTSLKDTYAHHTWQKWQERAATEMAGAVPETRLDVMSGLSAELFGRVSSMMDRTFQTDSSIGFADALKSYEERAADPKNVRGISFGIEAIDKHTHGIHPGELAFFAAGPKFGKSYFLDRSALHNWAEREQDVIVWTLENSVEMTMDRIACMRIGIKPTQWLRGECTDAQIQEMKAFINDVVPTMKGTLHIRMPKRGERTISHMIRESQTLGVQAVFIDQLTFIEHPDPGRKPRHEIVNDIVHDLKEAISATNDRLPVVLAHQINRDGVQAAKKAGHYEMSHMAESAGVERVADWIFAGFQSDADRISMTALVQILAARREAIKNWRCDWVIESPVVTALSEVALND